MRFILPLFAIAVAVLGVAVPAPSVQQDAEAKGLEVKRDPPSEAPSVLSGSVMEVTKRDNSSEALDAVPAPSGQEAGPPDAILMHMFEHPNYRGSDYHATRHWMEEKVCVYFAPIVSSSAYVRQEKVFWCKLFT